MKRIPKTAIAALSVAATMLIQPAFATDQSDKRDFGERVEDRLGAQSRFWFGFDKPLQADPGERNAATDADNVPRQNASAKQRQLLAGNLQARYVTRKLAFLGDMISFWPNETQYTHLIVCIEQGRETDAGNPAVAGENPSVQRVNVQTGAIETILYGMSRCDGIRTTPWGTILATEENGADGRAYEIYNPLATTGHWVADRLTGDVRKSIGGTVPSAKVFQRPALGSFSWEGLAVLESGVVIAGDELSPSNGDEGGAIFKFIPSTPRVPGSGKITDPAASPLAMGTLYAMRVQSGSNYGQGFQRGAAQWIGPVTTFDPTLGLSSRQWAIDNDATGYYRPEDLHDDKTFAGPGVRVYWTNTGNSGAKFYGETIQMVDPEPTSAASLPEVQTFVEGYPRLASHDNLDVNPVTGQVYIIEDDEHGEVWSCLKDGKDENLVSDGCVAVLSITDNEAEPTGFIFDGTGKVAYYILQHGEQPSSLLNLTSNPVCGSASSSCAGFTDDLIKITGFQIPPASKNDD